MFQIQQCRWLESRSLTLHSCLTVKCGDLSPVPGAPQCHTLPVTFPSVQEDLAFRHARPVRMHIPSSSASPPHPPPPAQWPIWNSLKQVAEEQK